MNVTSSSVTSVTFCQNSECEHDIFNTIQTLTLAVSKNKKLTFKTKNKTSFFFETLKWKKNYFLIWKKKKFYVVEVKVEKISIIFVAESAERQI
jgi:hypothetical protein